MTEQSTDSGFKAFSKALELFPRRARRTTVEQMRNGRPFLSPQFDNEHIQLAAALASEQWLKATPKRPEVYLLAIADKCFEIMEQNQWASVGTHTPETLDNWRRETSSAIDNAMQLAEHPQPPVPEADVRKFLAAVLAIDFLHNVDSLQEPPKAELDDARQYAMPIVRKLDIGPDPKPIRSSRKYRIMSTDLGNRIYDSYMKEATAKTAEATAR